MRETWYTFCLFSDNCAGLEKGLEQIDKMNF